MIVRARVFGPGADRGVVEVVDELTPYVAETLAAHARAAGPGATLEVTLPGNADRKLIERVLWKLDPVETCGVALDVRCGPPASTGGPHGRRRRGAAAA